MKVFLIGFMGSGKSAAGKLLAQRLGCGFVDTDHLITKKSGMDIPAIFNKQGEKAFRDAEHMALQEIVKMPDPFVIATGGGLPCTEENMKLMKQCGQIVYLKRSPDELYELLKSETHQRPLLAQSTDLRATINQLLSLREPFYNQANYVVDIAIGETVEQVLERVVNALT